MGVSKLVDLLQDEREVIRNDVRCWLTCQKKTKNNNIRTTCFRLSMDHF
jgi:hypothetical protein